MIILGTNSIKATGFDVANSVRFDTNAYMHKTPGSAGSLTTWTFSTWIKRAKLGSSQYIFTSRNNANNSTWGYFNSDDTILFFDIDSNADQGKLITNRKFRDVGAWMHLAFIWNTTSGTAGDRIQLWVNGVRETSFSTQTNPDQNDASTMGDAHIIEVGRGGEDENYANFYMAETVYQNNSATTPVDKFGEYDSDSGIWKPINVSGLTAGTNGFYLDFEDSSNLGNDAFGGTDLTEVNLAATDQSTDTCTNNFATMNPLDNFYNAATFSEGNCQVVTSASPSSYNTSTIGLSSGKWFLEVKAVSFSTSNDYALIGISSTQTSANYLGQNAHDWCFTNRGKILNNNETEDGSYGSQWSAGDIIGIALNLDDNELKFYINGAVQDSGTAISITAPTSTPLGAYFIGAGDFSGSSSNLLTTQWNFGSPPFAISSGNTDANSYGNFEFAVPSGHFAISTKNLAEYG